MMEESVTRIGAVVDKMIARCDEIAACAQDRGKKLCNLFTPREARKTAELCLAFIVAIAGASSMAAVVASVRSPFPSASSSSSAPKSFTNNSR